ncbi:hypothetical protein C8Q80DRAFT_1342136 [Daedaleopsis nitida]|nr:hypothetical protein C8Q80DRAFT_1342136 [Daedaleopsis nitida]
MVPLSPIAYNPTPRIDRNLSIHSFRRYPTVPSVARAAMQADLPQYARTPTQHQHRTSRASANSPATRHGSSSRAPTEHLYHLTSSKGSPWLTLKMSSNAPGSKYLPVFFEGEAIGGTVALHREKEDAIRSISVKVVGQMTSSVTDVLTFVQVSETLWDSSTSSSTSSDSSNPTRLVGHYTWPFSIALPHHCQVKTSSGEFESQTFLLPGSFTERLARVHIQYQVVVTVHRSRFRVDSTLGTVFGYCPIIRPEAPSVARQLAYMNNTPLPGPEADPDGWKCLEPLHIRGSVFSTRNVDAICTLALAKPLCYTRGSVIPCVMTVETTDPQALDLLSAPRSPVVRLLRKIATGEATLGSSGGKKLPGLEYEHVVQALTTAVWAPDTARQPHRRTLHGEIHLSAGLKPTSRLGKFELSLNGASIWELVHSRGLPPKAAAFQPDGGDDTVLQQEPVVIGTVYAHGPRPIVHSPPGYDDASSVGQASEFRAFR